MQPEERESLPLLGLRDRSVLSRQEWFEICCVYEPRYEEINGRQQRVQSRGSYRETGSGPKFVSREEAQARCDELNANPAEGVVRYVVARTELIIRLDKPLPEDAER